MYESYHHYHLKGNGDDSERGGGDFIAIQAIFLPQVLQKNMVKQKNVQFLNHKDIKQSHLP